MPRPDPANIYRTAKPEAEPKKPPPEIPVFINQHAQRRNRLLSAGGLSLAMIVIGILMYLVSARLSVEDNPGLTIPEVVGINTLPGLQSNSVEEVLVMARQKNIITSQASTNQLLTLVNVRIDLFADPLQLSAALSNAQERSASMSLDLPPTLDENDIPYMQTRLARQLYDQERYDEAARNLREALSREPEFTEARELLAAVYLANRDFTRASETYQDLINRNPFRARYYNNLALAQLRMGEVEAAGENLTEAVRIDPEYHDARVNLGLLAFRRKAYREVLHHLQNLSREYEDHPGVQYSLGVSHLEVGNLDQARTYLEQMVRLHPERPDVYFFIARSYAIEENTTKAIAWMGLGRDHTGEEELKVFKADPAFDPLRDLPAFQRL